MVSFRDTTLPNFPRGSVPACAVCHLLPLQTKLWDSILAEYARKPRERASETTDPRSRDWKGAYPYRGKASVTILSRKTVFTSPQGTWVASDPGLDPGGGSPKGGVGPQRAWPVEPGESVRPSPPKRQRPSTANLYLGRSTPHFNRGIWEGSHHEGPRTRSLALLRRRAPSFAHHPPPSTRERPSSPGWKDRVRSSTSCPLGKTEEPEGRWTDPSSGP